jgi:hypothetical protein
MRRVILLVLSTVVVLSVAGVAFAAIPDSGGVIHSCYRTGDGQLRVIDTEAEEACRNAETALVWNQTGPMGPPGPPGTPAPEWPKWYTTQVLSDGSAFRPSLDGVTARRGNLGVYFVTFPRTLHSCNYFTTPTEGPIFAVPIASYRYAGPENEVMVKTYNADGAPADAAFQLGVICAAWF